MVRTFLLTVMLTCILVLFKDLLCKSSRDYHNTGLYGSPALKWSPPSFPFSLINGFRSFGELDRYSEFFSEFGTSYGCSASGGIVWGIPIFIIVFGFLGFMLGRSFTRKRIMRIVKRFSNELRSELGKKILKVVLFGSYARGDFKRDSDVDVFILIYRRTSEIERKIYEILMRVIWSDNIEVSLKIYDIDEYNRFKDSDFLSDIMKYGIEI